MSMPTLFTCFLRSVCAAEHASRNTLTLFPRAARCTVHAARSHARPLWAGLMYCGLHCAMPQLMCAAREEACGRSSCAGQPPPILTLFHPALGAALQGAAGGRAAASELAFVGVFPASHSRAVAPCWLSAARHHCASCSNSPALCPAALRPPLAYPLTTDYTPPTPHFSTATARVTASTRAVRHPAATAFWFWFWGRPK